MAIKQKLTSWEWEGLISDSNLADGHAHQSLNLSQKKIINKLPEIFKYSESKSQEKIQAEFEKYFFKKTGQKSYNLLPLPQYHPACSISIEVVANLLRIENKSLTLIHPTFDNLPDIFRRHNIDLNRIEESELLDIKKINKISTDALMIVCPNNPTGFELSKKEFKTIVEVCKKKKIMLIVDFSFRLYSSFRFWDQYEMLYKSGVDFVVFEDTGKTLPTLDLKLGILLSSKSLNSKLKDITNDFLLNVSPFIFALLTQYIKNEKEDKPFSFQKIVDENRKILIEKFKYSNYIIENPKSKLSVAWIKIPNGGNSIKLSTFLEKNGIFVLPGNPFFWDNTELGNTYFRVALARPTDFFEKTITKLAKLCNNYSNTI